MNEDSYSELNLIARSGKTVKRFPSPNGERSTLVFERRVRDIISKMPFCFRHPERSEGSRAPPRLKIREKIKAAHHAIAV
jgi:hypothetical protein